MRRWARVAAIAATVACGKAERSPQQACAPSDCVALGASCGAVSDGCGNVLQCGACAAGETCGAGGKPNVCGKGACTPTTCQAAGAACGSVGDGCGGTLDCGGCPAGETCGGGGKANVCAAPPACVKATCAAKGATCGTIPDACGGELACGDCKPGEACGAGGTANVCAPVPPTGNVGWAFVVSSPGPDAPVGAGADSAGNRYLLTFTTDQVALDNTLRLQKLAPDGKPLWTKEWVARGFFGYDAEASFRMAVTAAGTVYLAVSASCHTWETPCMRSLDVGGGAATDSVLVRLSADGGFEWQRELTGTDVWAVAVNASGSALVARVAREAGGTSRLEKYQWDGTLLATVPGTYLAAALDDSGAMVGASYGQVTRFSAAGAQLWGKALPGGGGPAAAAVTAKGTIVLLAQRVGDVSFGSSEVRSGLEVLYVLEADGTPRFARGIADIGRLAVDPTGRAAVVGRSCGNLAVEAFDLANADLWRRSLPDAAACYGVTYPGPPSYGADHRLFVTGSFWGDVTVAGKVFTPRGVDAIGVLLDP